MYHDVGQVAALQAGSEGEVLDWLRRVRLLYPWRQQWARLLYWLRLRAGFLCVLQAWWDCSVAPTS